MDAVNSSMKGPKPGGSRMAIQDLYVLSNLAEQRVVAQIGEHHWGLMMPEKVTHRPMTVLDVVRYHTWDDAWIPGILAGKTIEEVGKAHDFLLAVTASQQIKANFSKFNQLAIAAARELSDLGRTVHLSYGDFPAGEYLQHNVSVRAFWSYDMAKVIGVEMDMADDFVQALMEEFSPVVEGYRQQGIFPPAVEVARDANPKTRLMAMVGRE